MSIERFKNQHLELCRIHSLVDQRETAIYAALGTIHAPPPGVRPAVWQNACDAVSDELSRAMWAVVS